MNASGLDRAGTVLVAVGVFFAPLISLQPITPPPVVTYADVFLVLGFVLLAPRLLQQPLRAAVPFLLGELVLLCFSLVSIVLHPDVGQNASGALRLTYAAIALPLAFLWWSPSRGTIGLLAGCYLLGNLFSFGYGLVDGPREDGRYMGLAPHPNGFAITFLLGIALVPYLVARFPSQRWLLCAAGVAGACGIWLSGSRAALAVLVVLAILYVLIEQSAGALLLVLVGVLVLASSWSRLADAGGSNALARFLGATDSGDSDAQRRFLLTTSLQQINDHPLLGGGFDEIRVAHNIYVQVGAATGLIAMLGFLTVLVCLVSPLFTAPRPSHRLAYPALAYVLVGPLTDTLADTSLWVAISLAVLTVADARPRERTPAYPAPAASLRAAPDVEFS